MDKKKHLMIVFCLNSSVAFILTVYSHFATRTTISFWWKTKLVLIEISKTNNTNSLQIKSISCCCRFYDSIWKIKLFFLRSYKNSRSPLRIRQLVISHTTVKKKKPYNAIIKTYTQKFTAP